MTINISKENSFVGANKKGYNESGEGAWPTTKGVADANWQYTKNHPYKVATVAVGVLSVVALTTAYFMSPAYAAGVGAAGAKAAALVSPAVTAVSAFLVAHPLIATFAILAAVAAVITAGVLAYKNNDKANQIGEVQKILDDNSKSEPKTKLDAIINLFQVAPAAGNSK